MEMKMNITIFMKKYVFNIFSFYNFLERSKFFFGEYGEKKFGVTKVFSRRMGYVTLKVNIRVFF